MTRASGRRRGGVELARIRTLRAARDRAEKAMIAHGKICLACRNALTLSGDYCDEGYELAQARSRARYYWANRDDFAAGDNKQETLF